MEQMKQRIAEENIMKSNIDKKFSAHYDAVEAELKSSTVGLVTLNDMKAKQEALVKEREKQLAKKEQSKELQLKLEKLREKERKKEAKRKISSLSFTLEEEEDGGEAEEEVAVYEEELDREEITTKKRKLGKNPDVDTSFLPDRDREEEENRLREELRQEWEAKQEKIKSEEIEITFSYWDGSGHRRTVKMKKGNTMQQFLQKALEILRKDFSELRSAGVEQLMYIKEDLIIPHHHSFYDFIVTKARGKSGPLFNFDVHDDVRLLSDATVEKDEPLGALRPREEVGQVHDPVMGGRLLPPAPPPHVFRTAGDGSPPTMQPCDHVTPWRCHFFFCNKEMHTLELEHLHCEKVCPV
ncbi:PREDICTED: protein FAM50A isoform X1 [Galeopterus variegatus]|uniref:Protein FAM50A isoform X1 n=1 Tax=Galeopterus variegatus TaxID=482537 RepID=A0ABM0S2R6_GALVR|nr:PREDICTED: protein FAM50A isoform X1 [Galeopterus variegatus]